MVGSVTESAPTAAVRIAGATLTVMSGPDTGRSTTSDQNGNFQFVLPDGLVTLRVQAPGYVERSVSVLLTQDQNVVVELDPLFQIVTDTRNREIIVADDRCPDWWSFFPPSQRDVCNVNYLINAHRNGTLIAELAWADKAWGLHLAVYRSSGGKPSGRPLPSQPGFDYLTGRITAELPDRGQYVLQVTAFGEAAGGGPPPVGTTQFDLTLTHPN